MDCEQCRNRGWYSVVGAEGVRRSDYCQCERGEELRASGAPLPQAKALDVRIAEIVTRMRRALGVR